MVDRRTGYEIPSCEHFVVSRKFILARLCEGLHGSWNVAAKMPDFLLSRQAFYGSAPLRVDTETGNRELEKTDVKTGNLWHLL